MPILHGSTPWWRQDASSITTVVLSDDQDWVRSPGDEAEPYIHGMLHAVAATATTGRLLGNRGRLRGCGNYSSQW